MLPVIGLAQRAVRDLTVTPRCIRGRRLLLSGASGAALTMLARHKARGVVLTLEWDLRVKGGCWPRKSGVSTAGVGMASGVLAWC